ncbi:hypothetical protein C4K25_2573 [Pseudomonas chlororaphis]|nr:hypothetical protein C4K25_2573 [Pseudomonas chlororaphis]
MGFVGHGDSSRLGTALAANEGRYERSREGRKAFRNKTEVPVRKPYSQAISRTIVHGYRAAILWFHGWVGRWQQGSAAAVISSAVGSTTGVGSGMFG